MSKSKEVVLAKDVELPAGALELQVFDDNAYHTPVKFEYIKNRIALLEENKIIIYGLTPLGSGAFCIVPSLVSSSLIIGVSSFVVGAFALILSNKFNYHIKRKKIDLQEKKMYEISNKALIEWMKKEYNLDITQKTAHSLNSNEGTNIDKYGYPHFEDVEGNEYKLIYKVGSSKIVVPFDYHERLYKATEKIESSLIEEMSSISMTNSSFTKYKLSPNQQDSYTSIKKCLNALSRFNLNTEDKYELNRIDKEFNKVLELHSSALSLETPTYNTSKLDSLLAKFANESEALRNKQVSIIHRELELQEQMSLER
jgi:hypothetical protein